MKVYDMNRGEGKTTKCIIELAKNPKSVLLVGNRGMKRMIIDQFKGIENIKNRVFVPYEFMETKQYYRDCDIIIDELDCVLSSLLDNRVKFVTITSD